MTACISWGITLQALLLPRMMVGAIVVVTKGNSVRSRKQWAAMVSALADTSCTKVFSGSVVM